MFVQTSYFVLLGAVLFAVINGQHVYTNTAIVEANEGTQVTIHCSYRGTSPILIGWKKKRSQTESNTILRYMQTSTERSWDEAEYGISGKASLVIRKLSFDRDQGIFVCHGLNEVEIRVNVLVPPKGLGFDGIKMKNHIVYENELTDVTCKVDSANPLPHFSWTSQDNLVKYELVKMRDPLKSEIMFIPDRSFNNKKLVCFVEASSGDRHSAVLVLTVYYGPALTITKSSKHRLIEGQDLLLLCNAVANPRITKFRWQFKSKLLGSHWEEKRETRSAYNLKDVNRTDAGSYRCSVRNSRDKRWVKTTTDVDVNYSPSVTIKRHNLSDSVELTCTANGHPSVYTFFDWKHKLYGDVIRELPGRKSVNRHVLTLRNVSYQETGSYVCRVSNGIGPSQSQEIRIMPEGVPVFDEAVKKQYHVPENLGVRISAKFYAFPKFRSVTWTPPSGETMKRVILKKGEVTFNLGGMDTSLHGQQVDLDIKNVDLDTAGNYTLTVENRKGVSKFLIEVIPLKPMMAVTPKVKDGFPVAIVAGVISTVLVAAVVIAIIIYLRHRAKHNYKPRVPVFDEAVKKQYHVPENLGVRISAKFYAFPKFRSVTWTPPSGETMKRVILKKGEVTFNLGGMDTSLHGQQVDLDIKNVDLDTAGNYTLTVENRKGVSKFLIEVIPLKPMMAVTPKVKDGFPVAIVAGVISTVLVAAVVIAIIIYLRHRAKHNYKPRSSSPDSIDANVPLNNAEEQPYVNVNVQGSGKTNNNQSPSSQLAYADLEFSKNKKRQKVKPKPGYEPTQYAMIEFNDTDKMTD